MVALDDKRRTRVAEIIRAKVRRGSDAAKATRIRTAIKRLTDAFTWGAIEEDDYRAQLVDLRTQLVVSEHLPDERRIVEATTTAQDIPRAWVLATPEQRRRIVWSTFSLIRVGDGRVTAVRPAGPRRRRCSLPRLPRSSGPDRGPSRNIELSMEL